MSIPGPLTVVSVIPQVIDALVSTANGAVPAGVNVFDGFGVTDDPSDFLMIGVDDPEREDAASSAMSQQDWANANYTNREEIGDISCVAGSWNGDMDQKAARDGAFSIAAALSGALRADPSLGLDFVLWTSFGTGVELQQNQDDAGALALVKFSIHFQARI